MDWIIFRPASTGNLTFSLAHVSCDWDMFASSSWKLSNHFILEMLYLSRKLLSPIWGWFKTMTCVILHSKQIKISLNSHPKSQALKQGTLPPEPLKEESRWGGPTKLSVRQIRASMSKGTETDSHPGDDLHCTSVRIQHQSEAAFNSVPCLWKWPSPGSFLAD